MKPALGVLGGMFDPPHDGHLHAARYAIEKSGLSKIILVPCGIPNHRAAAISSGGHRLNMLRRAIASIPEAEVSDFEVKKQGVSYTVDTLAWLKQKEPHRSLVFVMGIDAFNGMLGWHRWQDILALSNLLVLSRSGLAVDGGVAEAIDLDRRAVDSAAELGQKDAGAIYVATDFDHDISSTGVRHMLESGDQPQCVHEEVLGYIKEHRLYGQG